MNDDPGDDHALIARIVRDGDESAFRALYERHGPYLYRLALRLSGGEAATAEDLVHDAWVDAAQRFDRWAGLSALRTWLAGFVVNKHRAALRRAGVTEPVEQVADAREGREAVIAARIDLERAIAALPPGFRTVLVLHDAEGYTHEEIARLLGIQVGTSKSQLARARAAMRALLLPEVENSR